jgi:hypothetical protein
MLARRVADENIQPAELANRVLHQLVTKRLAAEITG